MLILFIIIFGIAALWDGFTTIYGTINILGDGLPQIIVSIIYAVMIMAILLFTSRIWDGYSDGFVVIIMRIFWWIAFGYDLYTSYLGNHNFVMSGNVEGFTELLLLLGLTLIVSASPIFASWVLDNEDFF